jgi:ankyrin repeat protein
VIMHIAIGDSMQPVVTKKLMACRTLFQSSSSIVYLILAYWREEISISSNDVTWLCTMGFGTDWYYQMSGATNLQLLKRSSPLMLACERGNVETIKLILSHKNVDSNAKNKDGQTAIFMASRNGHEAVVKLLLSQTDIAINTQAANGWTALMWLPRKATTQSSSCFSHRRISQLTHRLQMVGRHS